MSQECHLNLQADNNKRQRIVKIRTKRVDKQVLALKTEGNPRLSDICSSPDVTDIVLLLYNALEVKAERCYLPLCPFAS